MQLLLPLERQIFTVVTKNYGTCKVPIYKLTFDFLPLHTWLQTYQHQAGRLKNCFEHNFNHFWFNTNLNWEVLIIL